MSGGTPPRPAGAGTAGPRGALAAAGGVAGLTLVSRVLGFLRWIVQASTLGAGTVAGAYATANQVPNVLYEVVVGGALAATVVPLLAGPVAAGRREEAARTASALLGLVLVVLVPLCLALVVLAEPVAGLFPASQGVDAAVQVALVADFLRMFALQIPLYGIGVVLTGVLQAHGSFTWPALAPVLSSLTVMAAYGAYGAMAPAADGRPSAAALHVLGWGTTAGVAALSLPLLWPVHRLGLRLRPTLRLGGAQAGRALRLAGAGIGTLLAQQASVLAVLALARSGGTTGTVAVYQYTQAVYVLPYAVLAVPVATVLYPRLTAAFSAERRPPAPAGGAPQWMPQRPHRPHRRPCPRPPRPPSRGRVSWPPGPPAPSWPWRWPERACSWPPPTGPSASSPS
ncbi:murein biosynthesis integral membrane protein MurJ [Actinomyces bowdenii]|uniref:murein biosynthesis integral membrane protein MurJ n=1 Tax=Actinomyces bowdenii TaxID=131109 RepID=UPI001FD3BCED|nr:lipid II flippase MurJ [Actinomyces bowdenii]